MPKDKTVLQFKVYTKGQWAYILWPWACPATFLYDGLVWEAWYDFTLPVKLSRQTWIEIRPKAGWYGEYTEGLHFGMTKWGPHVYRKFHARASHDLTQHGLDGLPKLLWDAAYEYQTVEPIGNVRFKFRMMPENAGAFEFSFYEWQQYFCTGRNEHIRRMAITVTKKKENHG